MAPAKINRTISKGASSASDSDSKLRPSTKMVPTSHSTQPEHLAQGPEQVESIVNSDEVSSTKEPFDVDLSKHTINPKHNDTMYSKHNDPAMPILRQTNTSTGDDLINHQPPVYNTRRYSQLQSQSRELSPQQSPLQSPRNQPPSDSADEVPMTQCLSLIHI